MPDFMITSPEGKKFKVTAPAGASQQDILSYAQQHFSQQQQSAPNLVSEGKNTLGEMMGDIRAAIGKPPQGDIKYDKALPMSVRTELSSASNPEEQRRVLEKHFPGKVTKDASGQFIVEKDGQKISSGGGGIMGNIAADVYGNLPAVGASMAGAGIGAEMLGLPGALAGGAAGAIIGTEVQEHRKKSLGTRAKTHKEYLENLAEQGALGAGSELLGPAAKGVGRGVRGAFRKFIGSTPETRSMAREVVGLGGKVGPSSYGPEAKPMQFKAEVASKVTGLSTEPLNIRATKEGVRRLLANNNIQGAEELAKKIMATDTSGEGAQTARDIVNSINRYKESLENAGLQEQENAQRILDSNVRTIEKSFGRQPYDLGADVAEAISLARKDFGTAMSKPYARVDQLTGGKPLVPTKGIAIAVGDLTKDLPNITDPKVANALGTLNKLATQDKITFKQAQNLRSDLKDLATSPDLIGSRAKRAYSQLADSIDRAFVAASNTPEAAPAAKLLAATDKAYSQGIKKFELKSAQNLVNQAKKQTIPDAKKVVEGIIRPGYTYEAMQMKKIVGDRVWRRIAAQDFKNLLDSSVDVFGNQKPKALLDIIQRRGPMMEAVYGKKTADEIKKYAERLAMKGGKLPTKGVTPDNFVSALRSAEKAANDLNDMKASTFLSDLSRPGYEKDQAIDFILQPGHGDKLEDVFKFFGNNPEVVKGVRQSFLTKALSEGFRASEDFGKEDITPNRIIRYLNEFTDKQRKLLMPGTTEQDLRSLAKLMNFMFPKEGTIGGGLSAGEVKGKLNIMKPLSYVPYGYKAFQYYVLTNPKIMTLAGAIERAPEAEKTHYVQQLANTLADMYTKTEIMKPNAEAGNQ